MDIETKKMPLTDCYKKEFCWIHMQKMPFFVYLGANVHEKKLGQNVEIDLSICIPFTHTQDRIEETLDYGLVYEFLLKEVPLLGNTYLMEYFCERLLDALGDKFPEIKMAKLSIKKGYVPLEAFPGKVKIVAKRKYISRRNYP